MSDAVAELASLFELYRIHYGQSPAPAATRAWVGEMARSGELEFYGAYHGPRMVGFAAIHRVPASLGLGRFWQLRDLFADPAVRRQGIARRLVETIPQAASDAGALRLSLHQPRRLPGEVRRLRSRTDCSDSGLSRNGRRRRLGTGPLMAEA